jgi:hypothetical protein
LAVAEACTIAPDEPERFRVCVAGAMPSVAAKVRLVGDDAIAAESGIAKSSRAHGRKEVRKTRFHR